jgi:hypothetical protein
LVELEGAGAFLEKARDFLVAREAENNLILGLTYEQDTSPRYKEHILLVVEDDSGVRLAAIQTPPHNLVVSTSEDLSSLGFLAEALAAKGLDLPGITGPSEEAAVFAEKWDELAGTAHHILMEQRIFKLTSVESAGPVPGRLRPTREADIELMAKWLHAFQVEANPSPEDHSIDRSRETALGFLKNPDRKVYFWEDGEPVSMAGHSGPTPNGIRISAVYTPQERRRRGYASSLVAALSQRLLDDGRRFCFLYTDVANPTSNHIYEEIGYEPVCNSTMYRFEKAHSAAPSTAGQPGWAG